VNKLTPSPHALAALFIYKNETNKYKGGYMLDELVVPLAEDRRLLVEPWRNAAGKQLVTVTPQYGDRGGKWHLAHSSLMLMPEAARALGPILARLADAEAEGEESS